MFGDKEIDENKHYGCLWCTEEVEIRGGVWVHTLTDQVRCTTSAQPSKSRPLS